MKQYQKPAMKAIEIDSADIIATSITPGPGNAGGYVPGTGGEEE